MKIFLCFSILIQTSAFRHPPSDGLRRIPELFEKQEVSTYQETGESSKGVVSALTGFVNLLFPDKEKTQLGEME